MAAATPRPDACRAKPVARVVTRLSEGDPVAEQELTGPVLFCFDGSDGSRGAMRAAVDLIQRPADAVVVTVWESVATRLALSGAFAAGNITGGEDLDAAEESFAKSVADEGALRAGEHGYNATALTKESF